MPNWCSNHISVSHEDPAMMQKFNEVVKNGNLFETLLPLPTKDGEWDYGTALEYWGTKWDGNFGEPERVDDNTIKFTVDTAWGPPVALWEYIYENEGYDVTAYYLEEGMAFCGQYIDGNDDFYEFGDMSADEMEEQLPDWVEDQFNLISQTRDNEEWNSEEEEENEYIPAQYSDEEKTDWYPAKTKPHYNGHYEVKTKEWPFPHLMKWNNNRWCMAFTDSSTASKITEWRGLKETEEVKEMNLRDSLDELKIAFAELTNE